MTADYPTPARRPGQGRGRRHEGHQQDLTSGGRRAALGARGQINPRHTREARARRLQDIHGREVHRLRGRRRAARQGLQEAPKGGADPPQRERDALRSDEQEGMVTEGFWESVSEFLRREDPSKGPDDLREWAERQLDRLRCFEYANCWIMADAEIANMWRDFAPRGIAIKTTVGKFTHARQPVAGKLSIRSQKIEYANHWSELEERGFQHCGIPLNRLFLHAKRTEFSGQNEIRFCVAPPPKRYLRQPDGSAAADPGESEPWCPVAFETLDWIDEIVAASSVPPEEAESIRRRVEAKGLRFRQSEIPINA